MKKLLSLSLVLALVGCASTNSLIGELPKIEDPQKSAVVVPIRISSFIGAGNTYKVALDGKDIHEIGSGQYAEFLVPEGEHTISVKCFGGWYPTTKVSSVSFKAIGKDKHFFKIGPNMKCAGISKITEEEANKLLNTSKKLNLENKTNPKI